MVAVQFLLAARSNANQISFADAFLRAILSTAFDLQIFGGFATEFFFAFSLIMDRALLANAFLCAIIGMLVIAFDQ